MAKKGTKTPGTGGAGSGSGDQKSTIGLALPGGSIPAAIVCGGIMRGFQQKKTQDGNPSIDKFAFISSLSGGNLPTIMYAYAKNTTSSMLLDADGISDPGEITAEELVNSCLKGGRDALHGQLEVGHHPLPVGRDLAKAEGLGNAARAARPRAAPGLGHRLKEAQHEPAHLVAVVGEKIGILDDGHVAAHAL